MVLYLILLLQFFICALLIYGFLMDLHDLHPLRKLVDWRHRKHQTPH